MKNMIFAFATLFSLLTVATASAKLPEGVWLRKSLVEEDGSYGSYYRGWYFISGKGIDSLITLGAHYAKQKLSIVQDDGTQVRLFDKIEKATIEFSYSYTADTLTICPSPTSCRDYQRTDERPLPDTPPLSGPEMSVVAKWCVDSDCEEITYSREQSQFFCNLNSDFRPYFSRYRGPEKLLNRYGLELSVLVYPYRLANDGNDLASFSASMYLQSTKDVALTLGKSGVVILKSGPFAQMAGPLQKRNISVEFSIIQ